MLRQMIFAVLVAAPVALVTWMVSRGVYSVASCEEAGSSGTSTSSTGRGAKPSLAAALDAAKGAVAAPTSVAASTAPSSATAATTAATTANAATTSELDAEALEALVAAGGPGIRVDGEVTLYGPQGLFAYIDGAAPLFIDRNFKRLAAAEMKVDGGGQLTCDVYLMAVAADAASIFAKERPSNAAAASVGDEAWRGKLALVFRRGPLYVKLTAFDAAADAALPKLASALTARMP